MSRDITIYARKAETIALDEILARMRARGIAVEWQADPFVASFIKSAKPGTWRAGYIVPEGNTASEDRIAIATGPLRPRLKQSVAASYKEELTQTQREALLAAQTSYELSVGWLPNHRRERILAHLVDVLADIGDGLILDTATNQFYDRTQHREQRAEFFDQKSQ